MNLLIIGAGGHGRVVANIAKLTGKYDDILFFDDASQSHVKVPLSGRIRDIEKHTVNADAFVAIGDNRVREQIVAFTSGKGFKIAALIHPSAIISENTDIGDG